MNKSISGSLLIIAGMALSGGAAASVTYDANGEGFVGKGDVQSLYDWNNATFQSIAGSATSPIQFRLLAGSSATWACQGVNPAGKVVTQTMSFESNAVTSGVNYDARKNNSGQVTGFKLNGVDVSVSAEITSVGTCNHLRNWQVQPAFVEGSLEYEGSGEPMLQVSIDGEDWRDLPISE